MKRTSEEELVRERRKRDHELNRGFLNKVDTEIKKNLDFEASRNRERFLRMRAAGKSYYRVDETKLFWLTDSEAAERRAEASSMVPAEIDYEEAGQGMYTPYKTADVAKIDRMLAAGEQIRLRNC